MPFAIAGGAAGPDEESLLNCCAICPVLPLVIVLSILAVVRNSFYAGLCCFLASGTLGIIAILVVAAYKPSEDSDVISDQENGREALWKYAFLTAISGSAFLYVTFKRFIRNRVSTAELGPAERKAYF